VAEATRTQLIENVLTADAPPQHGSATGACFKPSRGNAEGQAGINRQGDRRAKTTPRQLPDHQRSAADSKHGAPAVLQYTAAQFRVPAAWISSLGAAVSPPGACLGGLFLWIAAIDGFLDEYRFPPLLRAAARNQGGLRK